jgi:hypothetical protein
MLLKSFDSHFDSTMFAYYLIFFFIFVHRIIEFEWSHRKLKVIQFFDWNCWILNGNQQWAQDQWDSSTFHTQIHKNLFLVFLNLFWKFIGQLSTDFFLLWKMNRYMNLKATWDTSMETDSPILRVEIFSYQILNCFL